MSLLTELDSFCDRNLQDVSPTGLKNRCPSVVKNSNANGPNRPSQNENRKRVPVRLHPLSCDFSATSQISVIAQPRAPRPVK
jgi:hypothetical protein